MPGFLKRWSNGPGNRRAAGRITIFIARWKKIPHRFLNVMLKGTYITPHRHLDPPKSESFLVLSGEIAFFTFDNEGGVLQVNRLGAGQDTGVDIQPGVWHTLAVVSDHAICFEVKPGPYSAANDKDFAPWAPREGDRGSTGVSVVARFADRVNSSQRCP